MKQAADAVGEQIQAVEFCHPSFRFSINDFCISLVLARTGTLLGSSFARHYYSANPCPDQRIRSFSVRYKVDIRSCMGTEGEGMYSEEKSLTLKSSLLEVSVGGATLD